MCAKSWSGKVSKVAYGCCRGSQFGRAASHFHMQSVQILLRGFTSWFHTLSRPKVKKKYINVGGGSPDGLNSQIKYKIIYLVWVGRVQGSGVWECGLSLSSRI